MKHEYGKLRQKLLLRMLAIAVGVLLLWVFVQFVLIDRVLLSPIEELPPGMLPADADVLTMDADMIAALSKVFAQRQNTYLATIGILVLLLAVFFYMLMRLTKYFREASEGIDKLLETGDARARLSPELDFLETKLNDVKQELDRREKEARDAERRKDELVAYLAHDIRTPLTTVIGYLNLLTEQPDITPERRVKYLSQTLDSAKRLDALVCELFEITRFNVQGIHLDLRGFDLTFLLRQLGESFHPILQPQGKKIVFETPSQLMLKGDADKLARVFRNILKNAAVFSDDGSTIRVEAKEGNADVTVTISDTGAHIPHQELEAIFDKFHRLDNARNAKTGGTGLGLAIAKEIVHAHGGAIQAKSDGNETVFTVSLPR